MGAEVYSLAMDPGENPVSFAVLFAHFFLKKKKIQEKDEQGCRNSNNCYFFFKHLQCVR